jgi:hypothetical protein|uniref:Uncharacterized protein n=1 Tax=viral metagenome TaxID=1070528 RepID=A0A6C0JP32_9ZZZZ
MSRFDSLITYNKIGYLPNINESFSLFQKEIFYKARNIAIIKLIKTIR